MKGSYSRYSYTMVKMGWVYTLVYMGWMYLGIPVFESGFRGPLEGHSLGGC